jgi:hypothetical protein
MIVILFCVAFSSCLNFDGLTLQTLFEWFLNHPILFLLAIWEYAGVIRFNFNIKVN